MVCLYSESYKKYYYAPWLSMPTCVVIFSIIGVILVPFFIQFGKINFWGETDSYYERPIVSSTPYYIIDGITVSGLEKCYSSVNKESECNTLEEPIFEPESDKISFRGNLDETEFSYLRILYFLNYEIKKEIKKKFLVMTSVELGSIKNVNEINIKGNLLLSHNEPFEYPEASTTKELKDTYFDMFRENDEIFKDFSFNRPQVAKYDIYKEEFIKNKKNPSESSREEGKENNPLKFKIEINIPTQQKIIYRRPAYINLKFRWIEYLALFIPVVFIVYSIISFMFRYQLVECSVISSIPKAMN